MSGSGGTGTECAKFPPWAPIPLFLAAAAAYQKTIGKKDKSDGSKDGKGILEALRLPFFGGKTDDDDEENDKAKTGVYLCSGSSAVDRSRR